MYSVFPFSLLTIVASFIIGTAAGQNDHSTTQPVQIHQYFNTDSSGGRCQYSEEVPITIGMGPQGKPGKRGAQGLKGVKGNKVSCMRFIVLIVLKYVCVGYANNNQMIIWDPS